MLFAAAISENFGQALSKLAGFLRKADRPTPSPPTPQFQIYEGKTRFNDQRSIAVEADRFEDCCAGVNAVRQRMPETEAVVCFGDVTPTSSRKYVCVGRILYVG